MSPPPCDRRGNPAQSQRPGSATQRPTGCEAVTLVSLTNQGTAGAVSVLGLVQRLRLGCSQGSCPSAGAMARAPTHPLYTQIPVRVWSKWTAFPPHEPSPKLILGIRVLFGLRKSLTQEKLRAGAPVPCEPTCPLRWAKAAPQPASPSGKWV